MAALATFFELDGDHQLVFGFEVDFHSCIFDSNSVDDQFFRTLDSLRTSLAEVKRITRGIDSSHLVFP